MRDILGHGILYSYFMPGKSMKKINFKIITLLCIFALTGNLGYAADIHSRDCLAPSLQIQRTDLQESISRSFGQGMDFAKIRNFERNENSVIGSDFNVSPEYITFLRNKDKADSPGTRLRKIIFSDPRLSSLWFAKDIKLSKRFEIVLDEKIAAAFKQDIFALKQAAANIHFQDRYGLGQLRLVTEKEEIVYPGDKTRRVLFPLGQSPENNIAFTLCSEIDLILAKNPRLSGAVSVLEKELDVSLVIAGDFEIEDEEDALAFVHHAEPDNKKEIIFSGIKLAGEKIFVKNARIDFRDKIILREDGFDITLLGKVISHEIAHLFLARDYRFLLPMTAEREKSLEDYYARRFGVGIAEHRDAAYKAIEVVKALWLEKMLELLRDHGERAAYSQEQILKLFISMRSFDSAEEFFAEYLGLFLLDPEYVRGKDPQVFAAIDCFADWDTIIPNMETAKQAGRREQILELLQEINAEEQSPGTGVLPQIIVMSDFHGEIELFFRYLEDSLSNKLGRKIKLDYRHFPAVSIQEQLEAQHVSLDELYSLNLRFYFLGDFSDRGKYGIKCFRASEELKRLGLARVVTGNHDLMQLLAAMGYHLPIYKGYNFYGHNLSEELVEQHWNDPDITQDRFGWWSQKLSEYTKAQREFQKEFLVVQGAEKDINDIREELKKTYLSIRGELSEEERQLWRDLSGFYFETTDVYTGFNAIGMMSLDWWEDKLEQAEMFLEQAAKRVRWRGEKEAWSHELIVWKELFEYTKAAEAAVRKKFYQAQKPEGKWWYRVFNDINHQNYESVEWYAQDWIFHLGWGTNVIAELNELDPDRAAGWTPGNFMHNKHIQDFARFSRDNFTLFIKDEYGNYYMHGWLPVELAAKKIKFVYQGVNYEGENIWAGLEKIQGDIRDRGKPWSELREAFQLVMSWYADKTTRIKPGNIQEVIRKVGLARVQAGINAQTLFTCHNPLNTLQLKGIGFKMQDKEFIHFSVDKGMSWQKFKDVGGYVVVDRGVKLRGYDSPDFQRIIDSPQTLTLKRSKDGKWDIIQNWDNPGLEADDFFQQMRGQLSREILGRDRPRQKTSADIRATPAKMCFINEALTKELIEAGI